MVQQINRALWLPIRSDAVPMLSRPIKLPTPMILMKVAAMREVIPMSVA